MFRSLIRTVGSVGLLWLYTSVALAGTFTPAEGTTISSVNVTVAWQSDQDQQWVRAFNSSAERIYDSGRLMQSTGSVDFTIADDLDELRIIFYEKNNNSSWTSQIRNYSVSLGGNTLAELSCNSGEIAKYNGSAWVCATVGQLLCDSDETLEKLDGGQLACVEPSLCPRPFDDITTFLPTILQDDPGACLVYDGINRELLIELDGPGPRWIEFIVDTQGVDSEPFGSIADASACARSLGCQSFDNGL